MAGGGRPTGAKDSRPRGRQQSDASKKAHALKIAATKERNAAATLFTLSDPTQVRSRANKNKAVKAAFFSSNFPTASTDLAAQAHLATLQADAHDRISI